jgi:hypothetical protein
MGGWSDVAFAPDIVGGCRVDRSLAVERTRTRGMHLALAGVADAIAIYFVKAGAAATRSAARSALA